MAGHLAAEAASLSHLESGSARSLSGHRTELHFKPVKRREAWWLHAPGLQFVMVRASFVHNTRAQKTGFGLEPNREVRGNVCFPAPPRDILHPHALASTVQKRDHSHHERMVGACSPLGNSGAH